MSDRATRRLPAGPSLLYFTTIPEEPLSAFGDTWGCKHQPQRALDADVRQSTFRGLSVLTGSGWHAACCSRDMVPNGQGGTTRLRIVAGGVVAGALIVAAGGRIRS